MANMIYDLLYDYQKEAVDRLVAKRRHGLFDEPGSGKTLMALGTLERDGLFEKGNARILVLATKTGGVLTWLPHARSHTQGVVVVDAVRGTLAARRERVAETHESEVGPMLVIANHNFIDLKSGDLPPTWMGIEWDAIVIDESHKVLPTEAETDEARTGFWRGLARLKSTHLTLRIAMSGTPDRGNLHYRYGTWCFLLPERYNLSYPYSHWLVDNFICSVRRVRVRRRRHEFFIDKMIPKSVRDQEKWNSMEDVLTLRRTKAEVRKGLPPKRYIDVEQDLSETAWKKYEKWVAKEMDEGDPDSSYIRMIQFATCDWQVGRTPKGANVALPIAHSESWKRDWILEWLEDRKEGDGKVVIASQLSQVLRWLQAELADAGFEADIMDGSRTVNQRLEVQRRFQEGDLRIVLLNMSIGDSIDLDAADDMIFVDETQDPDRTTQTEDRIHRVSRNHHVFIWRLRSLGTVDVTQAVQNRRRFNTTRSVYEGRRGVEFSRQVLAKLKKAA